MAMILGLSMALGVGLAAEPATAATANLSGHVSLGSAGFSASAGEVAIRYSKSTTWQPVLLGTVLTDANGDYVISNLEPGQFYSLEFDYVGSGPFSGVGWGDRLPGLQPVPIVAGSITGASVILPHLAAITGSVSLGAPGISAGPGEVSVSYRTIDWWRIQTGSWSAPVTTDASGRYIFPQLRAGLYQLKFSYLGTGGFQNISPETGERQFDFGAGTDLVRHVTLPPTLSISGTVRASNSNLPVAGATINFSYYNLETGYGVPTTVGSVTDSSGQYTISGLDRGRYSIIPSSAGVPGLRAPPSEFVEILDSSIIRNFRFDPLYTATGHVTLGGANCPAGQNEVKIRFLQRYTSGSYSALTDMNGNFSVAGLPDGSYSVNFTYLGADAFEPYVVLNADVDGSDITGINTTFAKSTIISGIVRNSSGEPIDDARITALGFPRSGTQMNEVALEVVTYSGPTGKYSLPRLAAEYDYELYFDQAIPYSASAWPGYSRFYYGDRFRIVADVINSGFDSTMYRGGLIRGVVSVPRINLASSGLATVEVLVFDYGSGMWARTGDVSEVRADGSYFVHDLYPDLYRLRFSYVDDGRSVNALSGPIQVEEGDIVEYNSVLKVPPKTSRLAGADRYAVGVSVSQELNPDPVGAVPVVYLASGEKFPDALSAAPAAVANGGPLLLTPSGLLPAEVRAEIVRLSPDRIVIVGGTNSVSPAIETDLLSIVGEGNVDRLGGADRYAASRSVIADTWAVDAADFPVVYVATGANFPDAISASAAAGASGAPVLLVQGNAATLDAESRALIESMSPGVIKVAGGSVGPAIRTELETLAPVEFLGGADRFTASQTINADAIAKGVFPSGSRIYVTTGFNFPDGLVGAALAGAEKAPLYTVPGYCVPAAILAQAETLGTQEIVLLGGTATLTSEVASLKPCVSGARSVAKVERGAGTSTVGPSVRQPGDRPALRVAPEEPPR
ncbi:putative cell wall-binding protein [Salinibacterium sp. CAN_S4]